MKSLSFIFTLCFYFSFSSVTHAGLVKNTKDEIDPAQAAIFVKDLSLLKQAIANGSDVNQKFAFYWQYKPLTTINFEKGTLLMYAISVDWYEGVLELLRAGAKSNVYVKGIKPTNLEFDRCQVKEIAEMSDMMMAVMAGNPDIVKLMVIDGADTRGSMAVTLPKNCQTAQSLGGLMHMRSLASPQILEILKEGKKAEWAKKGLPAEGQRP
jgi:ankyrin repeat protein